jgi:hypothetical protein
MKLMIAEINPNAEMGPTGFYVGAGIFTMVALGTLISGLHPRSRAAARWRGGLSRSVFGTLSFSVGLMIMSTGMVVRGILNQHGPFAGIVLWLFCGGTVLLVLGPLYDLLQDMMRR